MTSSQQILGAAPANIKWNVVRGDTAILQVQFLEADEETNYDTSTWDYTATAYDAVAREFYDLEVEASAGTAQIVAPDYVTETWGTGIKDNVATLRFDLQVTIDNDEIWTPVIGTIHVIGDVTGGTL